MAHLCGGDANDVTVGTFVGYNQELGVQDDGFEKNLDEYARVFGPIIKYAADLGVTVIYENCPMEGWQSATSPTTYNNLPGTLAARKLMYTLIPSRRTARRTTRRTTSGRTSIRSTSFGPPT